MEVLDKDVKIDKLELRIVALELDMIQMGFKYLDLRERQLDRATHQKGGAAAELSVEAQAAQASLAIRKELIEQLTQITPRTTALIARHAEYFSVKTLQALKAELDRNSQVLNKKIEKILSDRREILERGRTQFNNLWIPHWVLNYFYRDDEKRQRHLRNLLTQSSHNVFSLSRELRPGRDMYETLMEASGWGTVWARTVINMFATYRTRTMNQITAATTAQMQALQKVLENEFGIRAISQDAGAADFEPLGGSTLDLKVAQARKDRETSVALVVPVSPINKPDVDEAAERADIAEQREALKEKQGILLQKQTELTIRLAAHLQAKDEAMKREKREEQTEVEDEQNEQDDTVALKLSILGSTAAMQAEAVPSPATGASSIAAGLVAHGLFQHSVTDTSEQPSSDYPYGWGPSI